MSMAEFGGGRGSTDMDDFARKRAKGMTKRHRMMAAGAAGVAKQGGGNQKASTQATGMSFEHSMNLAQLRPMEPASSMTASDLPGGYSQLGSSQNVSADERARYMPLTPEGFVSGASSEVTAPQPVKENSPRLSATNRKPSYLTTQCEALKEIFCHTLNVLLIFVPMGLVSEKWGMNSGIVFGTNFMAIVPLASLLGSATEALSNHTGQLVGGLLNATFGNAVEMIMCIQAVQAGLIDVVQANLLGSILSNLLLVLGMAIMASGMVRHEQSFNAQGAAANMTCQLVASISVCLPTVFQSVAGSTDSEVLSVSRICSIFLMTVYALFLFFMLKTHADLFADEGEDEEEEDALGIAPSVLLLLIATLVVAACSEALVGSIEEVSETYGLPKAFIGTILLPIVGNAAEHATAVTCAYKGMMDLALGVAVGSSTQIALFVVPCAVMFGWVFNQPMNLAFREFDTVCQMLSVFLVSQVLQHGNTNWLHGSMLVTVYLFIATQTCFIKD